MITLAFKHFYNRVTGFLFRTSAVVIGLCFYQLFIPNTSEAQTRIPHSLFVIDHWGVNDGLPVNNVMKLHQSREGYLWMTTLDGLVRFDGQQFKVYQTIDYPNLPTNRFVKLYEAPDSSLWIVTEQRFLIRFKDDQFTHIQESDGLNGNLVYDIHLDDEGHLWFGTDKGVSIFDGNELTPYQPDLIHGAIDRVFVEESGAVWFRYYASLENYRYQNGEVVYMFTPPNSFHFNPVIEETNGRLWFSSLGDVYSFKDDSLSYCCSTDQFLENEEYQPLAEKVYSVSLFHQGNFSFTFDIGRHYTPEKGEIYSLNDRPFVIKNPGHTWMFSMYSIRHNGDLVLNIEKGISSTLFDREGNLWVATTSEGLYLIKTNPFQTWSTEEGLPGQNVYPILEDQDGTIWAGTYGPGIAQISNNRVENIPGSEGTVLSFFQKSDGTLLTGYYNNGYYALNPSANRFELREEPAESVGADIYAIFEQENGDLWLGTSVGLFAQQDSVWKRFDSDSGFTDFIVRFFLESPDGSLWMATNGAGIARYKNGTFEIFGSGNGFGSNLVRSLFIEPGSDPDHYVLWVGSEDQGLFRLELRNGEPQFQNVTQYGPSNGLLDHVIHIILMDENQNFWFNTNRGIFKISKEELEAFHRGEISSVQGIAFTENDGLRNREGNGGVQPAGIRASDGTIWLPGQDGVTRFDPGKIATNEVVPPVIIEEIHTSEETYIISDSNEFQLAVNERDFEFRFSALSFVEPAKNEFRYRLRGFNDDWIEAGNRRMATYTNIPAGAYTFEVMGSNNAGTWNPEPAAISIVIAPYFYETKWFTVLMILLIGLIIYGGVRLRIRKLEQTEQKLKKLVGERTEQLQKEKEKTQEQADKLKELDRAKTRFFTNMSHEFRTPLTLIIGPLQRILSDTPKKYQPPSRHELERMLRNSKRLLRLMDQTLELTKLEQGKLKLRVQEIDLNNFLKDLVELFNPLCEEKQIELVFNANNAVEPLFADPYKLDKIIGNLISNAIKFTPAGGQIEVQIFDGDDNILVNVSDTGIGISKEDQEKIFERFFQVDSSETRIHEGSGIGLSLAREFAKLHQGELMVESTPGLGTTFSLILKKGSAHFSQDELQHHADTHSFVKVKDENISHTTAVIGKDSDKDQTSILIVEDNADVRAFIREVLTNTYRIYEASNGDEGLKKVSELLPDLIIADIMMPQMDGITFNRELKKDASTASIPVIFLTAKSTRDNHLEGLQEGADDYITKPFDPALLKARVKNLIESRHRLRNLLKNDSSIKNTDESNEVVEDPFLRKINEVLEKNYANPDFKVSDFAKEVHFSHSYLVRKLKKTTGLNPGEIIKKYRMKKAIELFNQNAGTVSEVAYAVGYKSLSYFSYTFKEVNNITPSDYLQNEEVSDYSSTDKLQY